MSNDLISRKETERLLRTYADEVGCNRGEYELANGILKAVCFLADNENVPTAYDLEGVIERLENEHINCYTIGDYKYNNAIDKALEIVQSGATATNGG